MLGLAPGPSKSSKFPKTEVARSLQEFNSQDTPTKPRTREVKKERVPEYPRVLEFVNMGASPRLDVLSRERVRSHAMLEFNRRKSEPDSSLTSLERKIDHSGVGLDTGQLGTTGRFRIAGTKARPSKMTLEANEMQDGSCESRQRSVRQRMPPVEVHAARCVDDFDATFQDVVNFTTPAIDMELRQICLGDSHVDYRNFGAIDPFGSVRVILSERKQILIDHYYSRPLSFSLMNAVRAQWFNIAVTDDALLHVILSHSAASYALLQKKGIGDPKESLVLRTEAIRIINERIDGSDAGKLSDATVGAVASLASYEALYGSLAGVQTHVKGLEQMVKLRGRLVSGSFSPPIQRLILWADLTSAIALSATPRFTPPEYLSSNKLHYEDKAQACDMNERLLLTKYSEFSNKDCSLATLDDRLTSAFCGLHRLTDLLNASFDTPRPFGYDDVYYSDALFTIQRTLLEVAKSSDGTLRCLDKCCSVGGMIYVNCCLRDFSPTSTGVCDLVSRLVSSLDTVKKQHQSLMAGQVYGHWLFWAIFVGAAAARRSTADRSHADQAKLFKWLGLVAGKITREPWSEIEKSLARICWSERGGILGEAPLWEEIRNEDPGTRSSAGRSSRPHQGYLHDNI